MLTKSTGDIGETLVLYELTKRQVPVYLPFSDNHACDMIAEFNGKLQKLQVKTTTKITNNSVTLKLTVRRYGRQYRYTKEEVDYFALVISPIEKVLLVKNDENLGSHVFCIRLDNTASQKSNLYSTFEIDTVIDGSFAQRSRALC